MSGLSGDGIDPASHEMVTGNLEVGISIKNLTKIFGLVSYINFILLCYNDVPQYCYIVYTLS